MNDDKQNRDETCSDWTDDDAELSNIAIAAMVFGGCVLIVLATWVRGLS